MKGELMVVAELAELGREAEPPRRKGKWKPVGVARWDKRALTVIVLWQKVGTEDADPSPGATRSAAEIVNAFAHRLKHPNTEERRKRSPHRLAVKPLATELVLAIAERDRAQAAFIEANRHHMLTYHPEAAQIGAIAERLGDGQMLCCAEGLSFLTPRLPPCWAIPLNAWAYEHLRCGRGIDDQERAEFVAKFRAIWQGGTAQAVEYLQPHILGSLQEIARAYADY